MVDTRFYAVSEPLPLRQLLHGLADAPQFEDWRGGRAIALADEVHLAGPDAVALALGKEYREALRATRAGAVVVPPGFADLVPEGTVAIIARRTHELFVDILVRLHPGPRLDGSEPLLEDGITIGANAVISPGVEIGRGSSIGANAVIGPGVTIGRNASVGASTTIEFAHLGNGVVIHPGARVGAEGFGWLGHGGANRKIPQLGRVIVQDRVEIGPNAVIDRGALGDTVIGEGTKIGGLVQIGHNSRIGRNCLIAPHCGLAGSTILEDSVLLGGGAASAGHLTIGRGAVLYARAAVSKDVEPGAHMAGSPAQDALSWKRSVAAWRRLGKDRGSGREE
jgi:UDP-3-O-[3-hydroxymyristoyl] glucosamine N-acyltransferase